MRKLNDLAKKRCGLCPPNGLIFRTTHHECNQLVGLLFMPHKLGDLVVAALKGYRSQVGVQIVLLGGSQSARHPEGIYFHSLFSPLLFFFLKASLFTWQTHKPKFLS